MKKIISLFLSIFMGLNFVGCKEKSDNANWDEFEEAQYHKISQKEAYEILEEDEEVILLDVRTEEEYEEKHIEGAILIPDYEIEDRASSELPDEDALILVYCRSGNRSKTAAKKLVEMGYTNVYDFGGINTWKYGVISE